MDTKRHKEAQIGVFFKSASFRQQHIFRSRQMFIADHYDPLWYSSNLINNKTGVPMAVAGFWSLGPIDKVGPMHQIKKMMRSMWLPKEA